MQDNFTEALDLARAAGHVLLENGAEISRVEETMDSIASYYGVENKNFFVLSNGIFVTGSSKDKPSGEYANVEFIPIRGASLEVVAAVNQLSREISSGRYSVAQARERLEQIKLMKSKPISEQILASGIGSAGFCAIFGGSLLDCAAAGIVGLILWAVMICIGRTHTSRLLANIFGSALATLLCLLFFSCGFGLSLSHIIIGSVIPLIPGIPLTNGIRDLAAEDYIAGTTRILDAMIGFLGIALGVATMFIIWNRLTGQLPVLSGPAPESITQTIIGQLVAAFVGTVGFAVLFGVPRKEYINTGIVGALGWLVYILLVRFCNATPVEATFIATLAVMVISRFLAVICCCPTSIFIITGIFPLVPGAGVFWTTYYLVSRNFTMAQNCGFTAVALFVAIILGIIILTQLPQRLFNWIRK